MYRSLLLSALLVAVAAPGVHAQDRLRTQGTEKPLSTEATRGGDTVADGSFEAGSPNPFWTEASATFGTPLCDAGCGTGGGTGAHTGDWWVWFGGAAAGDVGSMEQAVTVPTAPSATLRFWLEIPTVAGGTGFVAVTMDGAELFRATYADDQPTYATYAEVTVDVSAYADGQAHTLRFESTTTGSGNFFVDDVSIEAAVTGPSLSASPGAVTFPATPVGTTASQTITLTNNGTADVTITSVAYTGDASVTITQPSMMTLAPGASTSFTVNFAPASTGSFSGSIAVASNAPSSPLTIAVTGTSNNSATVSGTTAGGPVWNRPTTAGTGTSGSCILSGVGTAVAYTTQQITVSTDGAYTLNAAWTGGQDGFLLLYNGTFSPTDQCQNLMALSDDGPGGLADSQIDDAALVAGTVYTAVLTNFGNDDSGTYTLTVTGPGAVSFPSAGVAGPGSLAATLAVAPNPASGAAVVRLAVDETEAVTVSVYDVTGRQVAVLFDGVAAGGTLLEVPVSVQALPAGVYVVRASAASGVLSQRLTVVR